MYPASRILVQRLHLIFYVDSKNRNPVTCTVEMHEWGILISRFMMRKQNKKNIKTFFYDKYLTKFPSYQTATKERFKILLNKKKLPEI